MIDLRPSRSVQDLSRVPPGAEVRLAGPGPFILRGVRGRQGAPIVFHGAEPLTVGAPRIRDERLDGEALHFLDGCEHFGVRGVVVDGEPHARNLLTGRFNRSVWHGLRFRGCRQFFVEECEARNCHIEGFIWGNCWDVRVIRCTSHDHGKYGRHRGANYCHCYYPGFGGGNYTFDGCKGWGATGLASHNNGTADESARPLQNITYRNCIFTDSGSGGSGNVDLSYVLGAVFENCLIAGGNGGLSTWDDGAKNPAKGAKNVTLRNCTIVGGADFGVRLEQGGQVAFDRCLLACDVTLDRTSRATYDAATVRGPAAARHLDAGWRSLLPGVGWSPAPGPLPPQPEPAPEPPAPAPLTLEGRVADLERRVEALEAR